VRLKRIICLSIVMVAVGARLHAQQIDTNSVGSIKARAESGDVDAQGELGTMYVTGDRVEQSLVEAAKWFRKAAEGGSTEAQHNLGFCYASGQGVAQDDVEAGKWYRKAADRGFAASQYYLGALYADGKGMPQDNVGAAQWFRKAAEQGNLDAQCRLGGLLLLGEGVPQNASEAIQWFRKAAEQGHSSAQTMLGSCYQRGNGVPTNTVEAVRWFRKAAEQGNDMAQYDLGRCYDRGESLPQDYVEAAKWYRKSADQGNKFAQYSLAECYWVGQGVPQNAIESYVWYNLAAAQGVADSALRRDWVAKQMSKAEVAEGQRRAAEFVKKSRINGESANMPESAAQQDPTIPPVGSGSGFAITADGYLITNEHVVKAGQTFKVLTRLGIMPAKVVKVDSASDLALLKADGRFAALPLASSRSVKLGATVATVGFPNIGLQGFAPKLAKGEIASLSGAGDDARYFQISVPVQPGNSGGALVDERGNVVGVVSAKLSARAALASSGALPENVNYAVKSSFLLSFLESVPEVAAKLKEPETKERKFEDVVKSAEQAAVLVLVY
jgi:TPR repeat protein